MTDMQKTYNNRLFPKIMGVVNVTPDSFSDGGKYFAFDTAVKQAMKLLDDGADIIDIGGESSRPNAEPVSIIEEMKRVIPVISEIKSLQPNCIISVDTTKYDIASAAIDVGADIINDISGLEYDENLAVLAATKNAGLIVMHMKGMPHNMQTDPVYNDVVKEIHNFLTEKVDFASRKGVKDIIIDVGIGFGKTLEHNLELLKNIDLFSDIDAKLMLGISRKSFIGGLTGIENPKDRDTATAILHAILLKHNIDIIRVHNVQLIQTLKMLNQAIN